MTCLELATILLETPDLEVLVVDGLCYPPYVEKLDDQPDVWIGPDLTREGK